MAREGGNLRIGDGAAVDEEHVDPAVVVVVEEHAAEPIVSARCFSALAPLTFLNASPAARVPSVNVAEEAPAAAAG